MITELLSMQTVFSNWQPRLEYDGQSYQPQIVKQSPTGIVLTFPDLQWHWETREEQGRLQIKSVLKNISSRPLCLGKAYILSAEAVLLGRQPEHDIVALGVPLQLGQDLRLVRTVKAKDAPRDSAIKFQYYDRTAKVALQIGFLTFSRCLTRVSYQVAADGGIESHTAFADFASWHLPPNAETPVETFSIAVGDNPHQQLEEWADLAAEFLQLCCKQAPALGWIHSSWTYTTNPDENREEVLAANLAAIDQRLSGFGLKYNWNSIVNLPGGNPGDWQGWNENNLPHGIDYLVQLLARHNQLLGLWCGPFYVSSALTDLVLELDDALLKDATEKNLLVWPSWGFGDAGKLPPKQRPKLYALDPTHPKAQAFIRQAFEYWRLHGVRYFMVDFLEAGAGALGRFEAASHSNPAIVRGPEALSKFMQVVREAAGEDTYLLAATGPTLHCAGLVDAMRVGNDFGEGRSIHPEAFFYPASYILNGIGFWTGPGWALNAAAAAYYTHRKLYLNDPGNVLSVDQPIPLEHARVHAVIHAFSGSASMIYTDFRYISDERLALIKKTLPRVQEAAFPVDLFALPDKGKPEIFRYDFEDFQVLALYNLSNQSCHKTLTLTGNFLVWEFWDEHYFGVAQGGLTAEIPAESVRVFRLSKVSNYPQVLGTDMNILMGRVEITANTWNANENTLTITATRPLGERGSIFVHAPEGWRVKNLDSCYIAKDAFDNALILRVPCDFSQSTQVTASIKFARLYPMPNDTQK